MKIQQTILLFALLYSTAIMYSQGIVKGKITDNNNNALYGVNVSIKNTSMGGQSNEDGNFQITSIPYDNYTLLISYLGYKNREITIEVNNNILDLSTLIIYEGNELLQEVFIDSERANKFSRKESAYVSKMPIKNIDNSQVYSTITNQLLVSQSVTSFEEALSNAVGVDKLWSSTGRSGDGAGYYAIRGFAVQPQLVNGVAGITNGFINPSNVERVEVIKGPSATLFGSSLTSYGGLINIITKKPYNSFGGSISVAGGSFDFFKVNADVNVSNKKNLSFRLNTGLQQEHSFQDQGSKKSFYFAPSLTYKVNNNVTLNLSYEGSQNEQTNQTFLFMNRYAPLVFNTIDELNYDTEKSLTSNDVTIKNPTQNINGEIAYKISDNWSSQTILAGGIAKSEGYYTYLWNFADWSNPVDPQGTPYFALYAQKTDAKTKSFNAQQNFIGDFKIGTIQNKLLVGIDYLQTTIIDKSSNWGYLHSVNAQGDLVFGEPEINKDNLDAVLDGIGNSNIKTRENVFGIYASDVVNILHNLSAMASIRFDSFKNQGDLNDPSDDDVAFDESTWSPKFGIVYQPIPEKVSIFGNYQNSFTYISPELVPIDIGDPSAGTELQTYDLERANQFEFGVKTNIFNNKLDATLNFYAIEVKDKVMGFGAGKQQDAVVQSNGVEFELNANPVNGLNIHGGFSYNDSEVTKSASRPDLIGVRPAESGSDILYNFWGDYKIQQGIVKNLGFGAGFNGASAYNTMSDYTNSGGFELPAYVIFNAAVYYETKKFRISVKANNLFDEEYYTGWSTVTPQQPSSFLATFDYKF